jgi:centromere protein F
MSWALEEWKEGLPTRALQKIQELEGQLDKLKKEKQQRQFQLDTLEAALQKQKQKVCITEALGLETVHSFWVNYFTS